MVEINTKNYKILEEHYDHQRVLIHDIRGHMQVMKGLLESENYSELEDYLSGMGQDPALQKIVRWSDNSVLNVILIHHAAICKSLGIDILYQLMILQQFLITCLLMLRRQQKIPVRNILNFLLRSKGKLEC